MPFTAGNIKPTEHHSLHFLRAGLQLRSHHAKPYRKRQVLTLFLAAVIVLALAVELVSIIRYQSVNPAVLLQNSVTQQSSSKRAIVRSSLGFGFAYDTEQYAAQTINDTVNSAQEDLNLSASKEVSHVLLKPFPGNVPPAEAASEIEVKVETDLAAFATYKNSVRKNLDISLVTSDYFAPKQTNLADIVQVAQTTDSLNGALMTKTVYEVRPKFAGEKSWTTTWTTQFNGSPIAITVRGITEPSQTYVPTTAQRVISSMQIGQEINVKGLSTFAQTTDGIFDQQYVADMVSPAIVKLYHITCGSLEYEGRVLAEDLCTSNTGSGFLVSADGYIATNGHVVVYGAKDIFASALLDDQRMFAQYLQELGLRESQIREIINRPDLTAAAVSRVYSLPDSQLRLKDQQSLTIAATGDEAVEVSSGPELLVLLKNFKNSQSLKQAATIAYDYAPEDQLIITADPNKGFSASDVALLKIDAKNAPFISLAADEALQNQSITLFGFPADADNVLLDNSSIAVTVTNGTISAVRDSAGGKSKLYQTDADASPGSSGGPAVDSSGNAIGIVTYRFDTGEAGSAAKSYALSITDFKDLAARENVRFDTVGSTQSTWIQGLDLYSKQYYSKALVAFKQVKSQYPSHRMVDQYIALSEKAISRGEDKREPSSALLLLVIGIGTGGLLVAGRNVIRHYAGHRMYRFYIAHKPHMPSGGTMGV